jgi:undecaprenyl-diphosphatase
MLDSVCDGWSVTAFRPSERAWPIMVGVALLLVVLVIGWIVEQGLTAGIDAAILVAMSGGAVGFWHFWTFVGDSTGRIILALVVAVALFLWRRRGAALLLLVTVGGGMALNSGLKLAFSRVRPGLLPHLDQVDTFSFPSGHSANSMVLALALAMLAPARWRVAAIAVAVVVALLIGLSRLALAVHWPSDVTAGWIEGVGWVLLVRGVAARRESVRG